MSLAALHTLMAVASAPQDGTLTYDGVARVAGLGYTKAAQHVEMLSTGRNGNLGMELLSRTEAPVGKPRHVGLTNRGVALVRLFASGMGQDVAFSDVAAALARGPLPALRIANLRLPKISLGTFAVLLHVCLRQREFGLLGVPANVLVDDLGISNLPRHFAVLANGKAGQDGGFGVIDMVESHSDRRIKLPELTGKGHRILHEIASAIVGEPVAWPERPTRDALAAMKGPEEVPPVSEAKGSTAWEQIYSDETEIEWPGDHKVE